MILFLLMTVSSLLQVHDKAMQHKLDRMAEERAERAENETKLRLKRDEEFREQQQKKHFVMHPSMQVSQCLY